MNIAFIGTGKVAAPIADHLQRLGHDVVLAAKSADSESAKALLRRNPGLRTAEIKEAVRSADVVFLAVPFGANQEVLPSIAAELAGKVLVDCTNPVGPGLSHGLQSKQSGSALVQSLAPDAKVVKAFSVYGWENFEDASFPAYSVKPAMFFCGNDAEAKKTLGTLLTELGWEPLDVGGLEQALHLEHMTLLWVRMVRVHGHSPHMAWAALKR